MRSSLVPKLVFFVFFQSSLVSCRSLSKRELKSPKTVLGEVYHYVGNPTENAYDIDYEHLQEVPLQDLRTLGRQPNLKRDGFMYVSNRHVAGVDDLVELSDEHRDALMSDSIELVKEVTGATLAVPYAAFFRDHTSPESYKPVPAIHSDLSPKGAEFMKSQLKEGLLQSEDPSHIELRKHMEDKGIVILNVWRPIHTVQDNPLGFCIWDSLSKKDAQHWKIEPTDPENALQAWWYRKGQKWVYLSKQKPDEVYVFLQHDSRKPDGHGISVPHASFTLKEDNDKPPTRMSFETAIIAFVEPSPAEGILARLTEQIQSVRNQFNWNGFNWDA